MPLFSNRSQLTFIMWYEQNSGKQGKADCVTNVLATFWRLLVNCSCTNPRQYGIYLFYMIESKLLRMVQSSMCLSSCMSNSAYHKKAVAYRPLIRSDACIYLSQQNIDKNWNQNISEDWTYLMPWYTMGEPSSSSSWHWFVSLKKNKKLLTLGKKMIDFQKNSST